MTDDAEEDIEQARSDLTKAWNDRKLVLFLGAGVSQPYGLPSWEDLVLTLLLDESSKAFAEFWQHYRRPLAAWLAENFSLSPTSIASLARQYANDHGYDAARFREYLRNELYRNMRKPAGLTTLDAVVKLLEVSESAPRGWRVPVVVTFNFDDLLERELARVGVANVKFESVFRATRRTRDVLSILHVHGFLPHGTLPDSELVFTEDEYHKLSFASFHWAQVEIVNLLRNYTVLFIGLSMTDPNLRRLLQAAEVEGTGINHYALKKTYTLTNDQRESARTSITAAALQEAQKYGRLDEQKTGPVLDHAINEMLHQARQYDSDLLRVRGVQTLWFEDFAKIATFVADLGTHST